MIVYIATNKKNGKVYIGKTIRDLSHAKARHHQRAKQIWKYGTYSRFYSSIRKHGFENFSWTIVFHGNSDTEIQQRERELIAEIGSMDPSIGYNMTPGGDGGAGKVLSVSHKEKLKLAFLGEGNPQFGKKGKDHPAFGHRHNPETKAKISDAHKGRAVSIETRQKLSKTRMSMFAVQKQETILKKERLRKERAAITRRLKESGAYKGERSGPSKVSDMQRADICERRIQQESYLSISIDYPIGLTGIKAICEAWGPLNGYPFLHIIAMRNTKLDTEDRNAICLAYMQGSSMKTLAQQYPVGETSIHTVLRVWGPANGYENLHRELTR